MVLKATTVLLLLYLFYQDLRYRAIYWICFPVLLLLILMAGRFTFSGLENGLYNCLFLFVQMSVLTIYFSLKRKRWVNITKELLGWGDILFLLSVAFYFSPINYLIFYVSSLTFVLLLTGIFKRYYPARMTRFTIPLAGLQALMFSLLMIFETVNKGIQLNSDNWFIDFL